MVLTFWEANPRTDIDNASSDVVADIGTNTNTNPSMSGTKEYTSRTPSNVIVDIGTDPSPAADPRIQSSDVVADIGTTLDTDTKCGSHHDLPTLAMLKNEMSNLRYSKKKPKEGGWAHSIAADNIDTWQIITRSEENDDLSVHQLMIFLQAYSYAQEDMHKSFLQKCNLNQFFENMDAKEKTSDLKTIKKCLKLIRDANSDTTKIAKQIDILEDVSIVKSMIKVSYFVVITFCSAIDFSSAINFGSTSDFDSAIDFGYFIALTICIIHLLLLIYLLYVQSR